MTLLALAAVLVLLLLLVLAVRTERPPDDDWRLTAWRQIDALPAPTRYDWRGVGLDNFH